MRCDHGRSRRTTDERSRFGDRRLRPRAQGSCYAGVMPARSAVLSSRLVAALLLATSAAASAFSSGSIVCEVNALPFVPMASVVAPVPPPQWRLEAERDYWYPGQVQRFRIVHTDPARRARGVLLWVKGNSFGTPVGAGSFADTVPSSLWQFVAAVPPEDCGQWAVTHETAAAKEQSLLVYTWRAPAEALGNLVARAFIIDDCAPAAGGCRGAQALTAFVPLRETLYADGFE